MSGYPQVIGVIAAATPNFTAALPLLADPSGDGQTAILRVGGITATVGFPFGTTGDGQAPAAASGVGLLAFNGASYDRLAVRSLGTVAPPATAGVLLVQGAPTGIPLPISQPYSNQSDAQAATLLSAIGIVAVNASGLIDRIRVANAGQNIASNTPGVLVVQGSANGAPLPVSGSFVTSLPFSSSADGQAVAAASALALVGYNGTTLDRLRAPTLGTVLSAGASGALVVQSSPNAAPFPIAPIGSGALFAVPGGTANGALIGAQPAGTQGIRIYVPPNCDFKYTIASSAPGAPPTNTVEFFNPNTAQFPVVIDENLSNNQALYVTSPTTANPALVARWI